MGFISTYTIEKVQSEVSILQVAESLGLGPFTKGNRYVQCRCPFHNDKDASFTLYLDKNRYICFGCKERGGSIELVKKVKGCNFPDAVEYVAGLGGIEIEREEDNPEKEKKHKEHKRQIGINELAQEYFASQLLGDALEYVNSRWGDHADEVRLLWGLGYAPKNGLGLISYLHLNGITDEEIEKSDLFFVSEKDGKRYCSYFDRLMFPICDGGGNVVGFTGRDMSKEPKGAKYKNTRDSEVFNKRRLLYGWDMAKMAARNENMLYIVEGNPDAIRMHLIGKKNTVALCGGALSDQHIEMIKREKITNVCLLMDGDASGVRFNVELGKELTRSGLNVYVLPISLRFSKEGDIDKVDPDTLLDVADVDKEFAGLEKSRCSWYEYYTRQRLLGTWDKETKSFRYGVDKSDPVQLGELMREVMDYMSGLAVNVRTDFISKLAKICGNKQLWTSSEKIMLRNRKGDGALTRDEGREYSDEQVRMAMTFGIIVGEEGDHKNCYYLSSKTDTMISNFILQPLFHICDGDKSKRMFRMVNNRDQECLLELPEKTMNSATDFNTAVSNCGFYVYMGDMKALTKLKYYLYSQMRSVKNVKQLGWQKGGFWAWSNGVIDSDGMFREVDDEGLITIGDSQYYIPAFSKFMREDEEMLVDEKHFIHNTTDNSTLKELTRRMDVVYGRNAVVGVCFYLATLFRDVCVRERKGFPLLNIFGQKGTGKSSMAYTLSYLFGDAVGGTKMSATLASISHTVGMSRNAICLLDEYTSGLPEQKIEILKHIWDGHGRTKMNMDKGGEKMTTKADCGVILVGQEMTVADDALFSRVVFIQFSETIFSKEKTLAFNELEKWQHDGITNITNDLLRHRDHFSRNYNAYYEIASNSMEALDTRNVQNVQGRIRQNWTILLASYLTLEHAIGNQLPWKREQVIETLTSMMVAQNKMVLGVSDLSIFFETLSALAFNKTIEEGYDYRLVHKTRLDAEVSFEGVKHTFHEADVDLLYLNGPTVMMAYESARARVKDDRNRGAESVKSYLFAEKKIYRGTKTVRFLTKQRFAEEKADYNNKEAKHVKAWVLNYTELKKMFDITLDDWGYEEESEGKEKAVTESDEETKGNVEAFQKQNHAKNIEGLHVEDYIPGLGDGLFE